MPTIKNVMNGGLAEVSDAAAAKLTESGQWVVCKPAAAPAPEPVKHVEQKRPTTTRRTES